MIPNISLANFMKTNEKLFDCYFVQFTIDVLFAFCLSVCLCVRVCTRAEYKCVFILTCSVFSLRCCLNGRNILRFEVDSNAWKEYSRAVIQLDHVIFG